MLQRRVYVIQARPSGDTYPGWRDVYDTVNGGAFAVLLTGAMVGAFLWKSLKDPITAYLTAQTETINTLRDTIKSNSDTLAKMAETDAEVARALTELQVRQDRMERAITQLIQHSDRGDRS